MKVCKYHKHVLNNFLVMNLETIVSEVDGESVRLNRVIWKRGLCLVVH